MSILFKCKPPFEIKKRKAAVILFIGLVESFPLPLTAGAAGDGWGADVELKNRPVTPTCHQKCHRAQFYRRKRESLR